MSVTPNEHVALLLSCIANKEGGKIDFDAVAKECNIKTSGAAYVPLPSPSHTHRTPQTTDPLTIYFPRAKRYSRLITSHKAARVQTSSGEGSDDSNEGAGTGSAAGSAKSTPKKRKAPASSSAVSTPARKSMARAAKSRAKPIKEESGSEFEDGVEDHEEYQEEGAGVDVKMEDQEDEGVQGAGVEWDANAVLKEENEDEDQGVCAGGDENQGKDVGGAGAGAEDEDYC
ncbi:hypothetical protein BDV06DRAFT_220845 [Aspergillus oleicola]